MLCHLPRIGPFACAIASPYAFFTAWRQKRDSPTFEHFRPLPDHRLPGLSVVIAARNEELALETALRSLLEADYPQLQIVLVDDRSDDDTYGVAERLQREHPNSSRLELLRIRELPDGWLGKVHAMHCGLQRAEGDLVLLADADVRFSPEALKRGVSAHQVLGVDHLVAAPLLETEGFFEQSMIAYWYLLFSVRFQPADTYHRRNAYMGIGAFNLLSRKALQECDDLRPLRFQVIDDFNLGRLIKVLGLRQGYALSGEHLRIRWFDGVYGAVRGLEKNTYAATDYRPGLLLLTAIAVAVPVWLPLISGLYWGLGWGVLSWLAFASWGLLMPRAFGLSRLAGLGFPFAGIVLAWSMLRSAYLCEKRQGIQWRDSFYPLKVLKEHHWRFH